MRMKAGVVGVAFSLAIGNSVAAQENQNADDKTDNFSESVEAHFEKKSRQFITEQIVKEIGEEALLDLAKKIPGIIAKRNLLSTTIEGAMMALTINPAGQDSDQVPEIFTFPIPEHKPETEVAEEISDQVSSVIQNVISTECGGQGTINPRAVYTADLTIDGIEDLIVDSSGITCESGAAYFQPLNCGAQVCNSYFFINQNGTYVKVWEQLGIVEEITANTPPLVSLYLHGGQRINVSWNGTTFSDK